jgi:hypothetical protein
MNKDVAVLGKKIYELSALSLDELEKVKWEALVLLTAVYGAATPSGIAGSNKERETRWSAKIKSEGLLSQLDPKWHLRTDDGKPPAVLPALVSAIDNPNRDMNSRLGVLLTVPESDREPLTDLVRSLSADAWARATGDARNKYVDVLRKIDPYWSKKPWLTVLPSKENNDFPPISILIDNPGDTHDGGIHDNPEDDTLLEQWSNGIRTWDVDFLRDNPLAQLYTGASGITDDVLSGAGDVLSGAKDAAKSLAQIIAWAPVVLSGVGICVVLAYVGTRGNRGAR